jgi:hypothetical protein
VQYYRKVVFCIGGQHDKKSTDRLATTLPTNATAQDIREFLNDIEEMILDDLRLNAPASIVAPSYDDDYEE